MRASQVFSLAATALAALVFCPAVRSEPPVAPAPVSLWPYAHPDTPFLAGLDWQRAKNSPTGRMLVRQLTGKGQPFPWSGPAMAILDQVDRVLVSSTGRQAEPPGQPPPMVVAVEGRVDRGLIRKLMPGGTAVERFKGVDLFVPPKGQDTDLMLALVSDRVALIGDRESLARILEAPTGAGEKALAARAGQLAAQCEMWLVSAVPPGQAAGNVLPGMKQWDDIESMDLGLSLAQGLGFRANLRAKTEDSAKGLAALAQLVVSMAAQSPQQSPEITAMMKNVSVKTEGQAVRIAIDVPLAQLEKGVLSVKTTTAEAGKRSLESYLGIGPFRAASVAAQAPAAAPVAVIKPPPEKRTIRISGLEEGSKEIVYVK